MKMKKIVLVLLLAALSVHGSSLWSQCAPTRFYPMNNLSGVDVIGAQNGILTGPDFTNWVNRFGETNRAIGVPLPNNHNMDVPWINTSQASVNLWVRTDWHTTNWRVIARTANFGTNNAIHLSVEPGTRRLGMWSNDVFIPSSYVFPVSPIWINITYVANGTTNQIYVDGTLVLNTTSGINLVDRPMSRFFNNLPTNVNQGYTQPLDDIYVFDRMLTADEIAFMRGFVPLATADYTVTPACGATPVTLQSNLHANPPGVTYQWFKDGVAIPGATNTTYTIPAVQASDAGSYLLRATLGCLTQEIRPIILNAPTEVFPTITQDIQNIELCEGGFGSFGVVVNGFNNTYSWTLNGSPVMGSGAIINAQPVHSGLAGNWQVQISNTCGTSLSGIGVVTINPASDMTVTLNPVSQTACNLGELSLNAGISGSVSNLHWTLNDNIIPGQTTSNLVINPVSNANVGQYRMVATDFSGCQVRTNSALVQIVGMRHHYPIANGQAIDVIGGNNATISGQASDANRFGTANSSFFQNNINGGVVDITDVTASTITVSMWIKYGTGAPGTGFTVLVSPDQSGLPIQLLINNTNGTIGFFNGSFVPSTYSIPRSNTIWRHILYTSNGTTTRIFADGLQVYNGTTSPINPSTVPVSRFINGWNINASQGLWGTVDDIYIADRFVTLEEAQVLRGFQTGPTTHTVTCAGETFTFAPLTHHFNTAHPDVTFQWFKDGVLVPGQTQRTLTVNNFQAANAGVYTLRMSMNCIQVFSETVTVNVGTNAIPTFTLQPVNQTICSGSALTITAEATGSANLSYSYRRNGVHVIGGNNMTSYTIPNATSANSGVWTVEVSNACGSVISNAATIVVGTPATITAQPAGQNLCAGNNYTLNVTTTGDVASYQWRKDGVNIPGATSATLNLTSVTPSDLGNYSVVLVDACGNTLTSTNAFITVTPLISITSQPTGGTVCEGTNFTLAVSAFDVDTYQWTFNGSPIAGATLPNYTGVNAVAGNAGNYAVQLTNFCGTVTSDIANIAVEALPQITNTLSNQPLCAGQPLNLAVTATGSGLSYQWMKNGTAIPGATNASFSIPSTSSADAGSYSVVVANSCGNATSNVSVVSVTVPVAIITQPTSHTACAGTAHTFTVNATGDNLNYNWMVNGSSFQTGPSASLTLSNISTLMAGTFQVEVSNSCGTVASNVVNLTVNSAPSITTQPAFTTTLCEGDALNLSVTATGGTLSYQWFKDGVLISGATNASYALGTTNFSNSGVYTVEVTNGCGTVTSNNATLGVTPTTWIAAQPLTGSICVGDNYTFTVIAGGGGLTYQWFKDGVLIPGATANNYTVSNGTTANSGNYEVTITGSCGTVTSQIATLTVVGGPVITTQPQATTICGGQNGSISVAAVGPGLTYQWLKDGAAIPGATSATYLINGMTGSEVGNYSVTISGDCGAPVTSNVATVSLNTMPQYNSQPVSNTYCEGEVVTLEVTFSNSVNSIEWYKDGVLQQFSSSQELILSPITPANAGTYVLNAMNNCGNALSSTFTLTVNPIFENTLTESVCAGESVTVGGVTYTQTGNYTANMQTVFGCDSTVHLNLTVLPAITNSISATICLGDSYVFDGQTLTVANTYTGVFTAANGCDSTVTLQLNVIDPSVPFNESATICFGESFVFGTQTLTASGSYTEIFNSSAGCDSTVVLQLTVEVEISPVVTANQATANVTPIAGASYQWINCAGNTPISGATSASFTANVNGDYAVIVTVNDCEETSSCVTLELGDVSIADQKMVEIEVFPNPARDFCVIRNIPQSTTLVILNALGQEVGYTQPQASQIELTISNFEEGVYFLRFETQDNQIHIKKLVVNK